MRPAPRSWWRLVEWRVVAAVGLPVWAAVGGAVALHAPAGPEPPPSVTGPPPIFENAGPLGDVLEAPRSVEEPPAPPAGPLGPLLWSHLAFAGATGAGDQPGMPPPHPLFPAPDRVWAAAVEGQVRTANRMLAQAKLAQIPVAADPVEVLRPVPRVVARQRAKAERPAPPAEIGGCKTFDTFVAWRPSPQDALRRARAADKLVFLLHLAGNIEDDGFT